jgi:hypothetical protein
MEQISNKQERARRRELAGQARGLIAKTLPVEDADESSLTLSYDGFYLQIAFSELHPLMVLYLARAMNRPGTRKDERLINGLNLKSVLGSHAVNTEAGCYSYRAAHWLDAELTGVRFLEMLTRSAEEAGRAYRRLMHSG